MRRALHRRFFVVLALATACTSSHDDKPATPDAGHARPSDDAAALARAVCSFTRGALPLQTLGVSAPLGDAMPIQTIVVMMQENRSFDSYFSHLNAYAKRVDIESAPDSATNPNAPGDLSVLHTRMHAPHLCLLDTNHEWSGAHVEWDDGKMDGFYFENSGFGKLPTGGDPALADGERALWWYDETDIPFYYELAKTFAIGDHYYASLLGPTWPNRMYLYAGTSFGVTTSDFPDLSASPYPTKDVVIFDQLEKAHVTWNIYGDGVPGAGVIFGLGLHTRWGRDPLLLSSDFFAQAAAGTLPQVVFLDPHLGAAGPSQNDEHPPADVQVGEKFVSDAVHALWKSPQWPHAALFSTYDEHGGLYDHLAPPPACQPDGTSPILAPGDTTRASFDRYGVRVPVVVVSPYAKAGFVSHATHDHTSILRFIQTRFGLPALTARDANADPMLELFDFTHASFATPPSIAEPTVDANELAYCVSTFR